MTSAHPTFLRNLDAARRRYDDDVIDQWIASHQHADPLADAFVADFATIGHAQGMRLLGRALADGIDTVSDAPASLVALFDELDSRPDWVRPELLERAATALVRYPILTAITLSACSLTTGALNGVAGKPMYMTGRYTAQAGVRTLEVGSWLAAITEPAGLERWSPGFARTVRVRIIHALVRANCRQQWDADAWGEPIAQPHMAFTLVEFGYLLIHGASQLGAYWDEADEAAMYHFWRYIGHLCGVQSPFLPVDADDHRRILDLYVTTGPGPDDESRAFVKALTTDYLAAQLADNLAAAPWAARRTPWIVHGLQRALVGDEAADGLHIPQSAFKHVPGILGRPVRLARHLRTRVRAESSTQIANNLARRNSQLDDLRQRWGVSHDLVDVAPDAANTHPAAVSTRPTS